MRRGTRLCGGARGCQGRSDACLSHATRREGRITEWLEAMQTDETYLRETEKEGVWGCSWMLGEGGEI